LRRGLTFSRHTWHPSLSAARHEPSAAPPPSGIEAAAKGFQPNGGMYHSRGQRREEEEEEEEEASLVPQEWGRVGHNARFRIR
jgi:hypothetical protein